MKLTKQQTQSADHIVKLIQGGLRLWIDAAKIICSELDKDSKFVDVLAERGIRPHTVYALQRVGRGTLLPELVVMAGAGPLRARQLAPEVQRQALSSPVPVVMNGVVKKVPLLELTDYQARQAFDSRRGTIRSKRQQEEWAAQVSAGVEAQREQKMWRVGKEGTLVVAGPGNFTVEEVEEMLRQMKAKKPAVAA